MTHFFAIDIRSINYLNCLQSFDTMMSIEELNKENFKTCIFAFHSFINN